MRSVEQVKPRAGLSVPIVSVIDEDGRLLESEQRAVVRHVLQDGHGADVVFAAGTTGEWDRLGIDSIHSAVRVCVEEVGKENRALISSNTHAVEVWAGVTAHTSEQTLANLDFAIEVGADAAVLAPLSVRDLEDPVRFVAHEVGDLLDRCHRRIPVYLYDNANIAADPRVQHIPTKQVKALSRLDFVRGIKVSAPRRVLGNYTKAASGFSDRGEFGIYVGDAMLIFDLFWPRSGSWGAIAEHWNRRRLKGSLPVGVVAGPANALPREWAHAWEVCRSGDKERMVQVKEVLNHYRQGARSLDVRCSIACIKRALLRSGVIDNAAVAPGTPALSPEDAERFDLVWDEVLALARDNLIPTWVTRNPVDSKSEGAM